MERILTVDEQTKGFRKTYQTVEELKKAALNFVDENVTEIIIKKRAAERDPSQKCGAWMPEKSH